jgi:transposase InsO family protein
MLLRAVMVPLPMRLEVGAGDGVALSRVPAALVAEFAGHPVAGRPFFAPETVTTDHGSVYKNHHLVQVARTLGVTVLPARAMRPQDKASCERAFAGIQSLLLGYRGVDVADRGTDPEGDATWTLYRYYDRRNAEGGYCTQTVLSDRVSGRHPRRSCPRNSTGRTAARRCGP